MNIEKHKEKAEQLAKLLVGLHLRDVEQILDNHLPTILKDMYIVLTKNERPKWLDSFIPIKGVDYDKK